MDVLREFIINILEFVLYEVVFFLVFFFVKKNIFYNLLGIFILEMWKVYRIFIFFISIINFVFIELLEILNFFL